MISVKQLPDNLLVCWALTKRDTALWELGHQRASEAAKGRLAIQMIGPPTSSRCFVAVGKVGASRAGGNEASSELGRSVGSQRGENEVGNHWNLPNHLGKSMLDICQTPWNPDSAIAAVK